MRVKDIVKLTNTYLTGEQLVYQRLVPFFDAVIDEINSRLNSTYPSFSSFDFTDLEDEEAVYDFFPDQYIRTVVCLGAAHYFYEMDEEGVVYDQGYAQDFEKNLFYMVRDYIEQVPEEFQAGYTASVVIEMDEHVDYAHPICPRILRGM